MALVPTKSRKVIVTLTSQNKSMNRSFQLTGVSHIGIERAQDIGVGNGLVSSFLQPYYFKPTTVSIRGKSYIGAFAVELYNLTADTTRDDMIDLVQVLNQIQGDPTRVINLQAGDEKFKGFISLFGYEEDINDPFILDYSINFIGQDSGTVSLGEGIQQSLSDLSAIPKVAGSVMELTSIFKR